MKSNITIKFDYSKLKSTLYVGEFGAQLVRLNFTVNQIDTFIPLIDDKSIDFIVRFNDKKYFDIQVKTIRLTKERYFYELKKKWGNTISPNLLIAFVILQLEIEPIILLIPGTSWIIESKKNKIFSNRDYKDKKSLPEWGLTINTNNLVYLKDNYEISKTLETL